MAELPVVSGREAVKAFGRIGYVVDRQRGSHIILRQAEPPHRRLTIPDHKELRKGTLRVGPTGWIVGGRVRGVAIEQQNRPFGQRLGAGWA